MVDPVISDAASEALAAITGVLSFIISIIAMFYLFTAGELFWLSFIIVLNLIALERVIHYYDMGSTLEGHEHLIVALIGFVLFFLSMIPGLINLPIAENTQAPYLIFLFVFYQVMQWIRVLIPWNHNLRRAVMLIVGIIGIWFFWTYGLQGDIGNAGELFGEAGYGVEQAANFMIDEVGGRIAAFRNTALSPQRNPNVARMVCTYEMFASGGLMATAGAGGGGSASVQNCVEEKLGQNETEQESVEVTEPVTVQVSDLSFEPFLDHIRTTFNVENTLVYDIGGRPISIPAEEVRVQMNWYYLGNRIATMDLTDSEDRQEVINEIQNGDNRLISFEGDEESGYQLPVARVTSSYTRSRIISLLADFTRYCINEQGDQPEQACQDAQDTMETAMEEDDLNPVRIAFVVRTLQDSRAQFASDLNSESFIAASSGYVEDEVDEYLEEGEAVLLASGPNNERTYEVRVRVKYDYSAEAAFTESSRWRSGNHLLTIYTKTAWEALSGGERDQFERERCRSVNRYGQQLSKQRTVALTTPIVPVMYTDCSGTLFENFETSGDPGEVEISVGANVNDGEERSLQEDKAFRIMDAQTDCVPDSDIDESGFLPPSHDDGDAFFNYQEGVGYQVDPQVLTREITVPGDVRTVACSVQMDFRINKVNTESYTIPNLS